jgi:hypothetical protein
MLCGRGLVDGEEFCKDISQVFQIERVGAIGLGVRGVIVDFHEEAVDARSDCGA